MLLHCLFVVLCALMGLVAQPAYAAPTTATAGAESTAAMAGQVCHLAGHHQALRCVSVAVPLDYQHPEGAQMTLHVTVAPAFREAARKDPLFVLAGGPGQAGSDVLMLLDNTLRPVRATRDIVILDQRGTGLSGKLDCETKVSLAGKTEREQEDSIAACLRSLRLPFAAFTTEAAARDIDQVRLALHYSTINLWGASYGTRLAQAHARLFPQTVRALILDGVAAPEQIIFAWGQDAQIALDAVLQRCAKDVGCHTAYPDLSARFAHLLQAFDRGDVALDFRHPRTAAMTHLALSRDAFVRTVRVALYSANGASRLPFLIDSAARGNWAPFLVHLYAPDDLSVGGMAIGLTLAVTCAEDLPRLTAAQFQEEIAVSFMAGSELKLIQRLCRHIDVPARPFEKPAMLTQPSLLLSGALDPVTPPHRAASAARAMQHAQQIVVPNLGHGVSFYACAPKLLRKFLDAPDQKLNADCLEKIAQPSFQLGAAGPRP